MAPLSFKNFEVDNFKPISHPTDSRSDKKNRECNCCRKAFSTPQKLRQHYTSIKNQCSLLSINNQPTRPQSSSPILAPVVHIKEKDRRKEKTQTVILKPTSEPHDEDQEGEPKAGPGPTTQAHREMQRNEQASILQTTNQETDIIFIERNHNSARQHNNLKNMTVWKEKVPSSNNSKYAFNKQQTEHTKYVDASYIPQLIGASREAITSVLQKELHRKDQIKTALVINATYVKYKYKEKGDLADKANYEAINLDTYHRGKMGVLLSERILMNI
ncbi:hypothetical protein GLOIN_2v1481003 [Rhizophagus clarus]|uniref:Uncharacterized protein n=1 Tax=Rhizophagus clarus TaxID=94130 RepID=A0A8H3QSU7_9GLOM|nr:hypothetical protein GLOIN_2v1481003 [Rhizophagus clarus]